MKQPLILWCATLWLTACGPDLGANAAERCSSAEPCRDGDVCYRGFCLPEQGRVLSPVGPGDASVIYVEVESDGSIVLVEVPVSENRNPDDPPLLSSKGDAGTKAAADASLPDASLPDASVPATRPDASVSAPDAAVARPDASVPVPDAGPPGPCSNKECCDEARKWAEDGEEAKGKKKCGCDNFLQSLTCGLFSVTS